MADLESIIAAKNTSDAEWREQRQVERDNASAMRDAGIHEITNSPGEYAKYLRLQGDNMTYSAGNTALVMFSTDDPTYFGTVERWRSLGRSVLEGERENGVKIFTRMSSKSGSYTLADVYDIKQTQGKTFKPTSLTDGTPQMEAALSVLLNYSPVPVSADRELGSPALYDEEAQVLCVNPDYGDSESFASIAEEVAHARLHNHGNNRYYERADSELDAKSVAYMLCRHFGVSCELPDTSGVAEHYDGWDTSERAEALDRIQNIAKRISHSVEMSINPEKQKHRARVGRPAR